MKQSHKLSLISATIIFTACSVNPVVVKDDKLNLSPYQTLEDAAFFVEEFGSISMSPPILAEPNEIFKFDLSDNFTSDMYYKDAKTQIQGKASLLKQTALMLGVGASAQLDPTQTASYLQKIDQFKQTAASNKASADVSAEMQKTINTIAKDELTHQLAEARKIESIDVRMAAIDAAINKYKERMSNTAPTDNPNPSIDDKNNAPTLADPSQPGKAASRLASDKFAGNRDLLNDGSLSLTDRVALTIAQGDNAMEAIFRTLGNADKLGTYDRVFYGVSLVSVNPGWRTSENYNAQLTITPKIVMKPAREKIESLYIEKNKGSCVSHLLQANRTERKKPTILQTIDKLRKEAWEKKVSDARATIKYGTAPKEAMEAAKKIADEHRKNPEKTGEVSTACDDFDINRLEEIGIKEQSLIITAISPLSTPQTLDLSFSKRDQLEFSLALALALRSAGQEVQAKTFLDYAKSIQADYQTISEENSINIASNGLELAIEVGPKLKALKSAGKSDSAGRTLERQTFPVLLLVGLYKDDFNVKPVKDKDTDKDSIVLKEPRLTFVQVQQWLRNSDSGIGRSIWLTQPKRDDMGYRMQLADALDLLKDCDKVESKRLCYRAESLAQKIGGTFSWYSLPADFIIEPVKEKNMSPVVSKVLPAAVSLEKDASGKVIPKDVSFTLMGSNLGKITKAGVEISANFSKKRVIRHGDNAIEVLATVTDSRSPVVFFLTYKKDDGKSGNLDTSTLAVPVTTADYRKKTQSAGF